MAGAKLKYRHLGRDSEHRQALLRNLVTSLFRHESISTTYPKAKEAQKLAEKLVTHAKKNTNASWNEAFKVFFTPHELMPRLFGEIRERYANRPGGYTRVLRIEPLKEDQAPSAILELVDGPKDMRFQMTARTVARLRTQKKDLNELTLKNIEKVTRFRKGGQNDFAQLVEKIGKRGDIERDDARLDWKAAKKDLTYPTKRHVYPVQQGRVGNKRYLENCRQEKRDEEKKEKREQDKKRWAEERKEMKKEEASTS